MRKLIFIHIPKCAGNSIHSLNNNRLKIWAHNLRNPNFEPYPKSRLYKYISKYPFIFKHYYYSFAIVRNTWSRVYSAYNYLSMGGNNEADFQDYITFIKPYKDFEDFVKNGLQIAKANQLHFVDQLFWIQDTQGAIVVDEIIRLENINFELNNLFKRASISFNQLPHKNKSPEGNYRGYYNEEIIEIVREVYKEEIEYFNYEF